MLKSIMENLESIREKMIAKVGFDFDVSAKKSEKYLELKFSSSLNSDKIHTYNHVFVSQEVESMRFDNVLIDQVINEAVQLFRKKVQDSHLPE